MTTPPTTFELATPDGRQPVRVFEPERAPKGGVIVYMDAFGWREELDRMAARYAEHGFLTFLPDMYYRLGRIRFPQPAGPHLLDPAMHRANDATTMAQSVTDTGALIDWAASRYPEVRRFGTVGYCMGARHALAAATHHPERIVAAALLHGGRLVTGDAASPHLMIGRQATRLYLGFARDDETCPPEHQAMIEARIRETGADAQVEHYEAGHGWTFPLRWCHDEAAAEHAFAQVLGLFDRAVAEPG